MRQSREVEVRAQVQQMAARIAAEEQQIIDGVRQLLQTLAELNEIRDRDAAGCAKLLSAIRPHFQGFQAFAVTNVTGVVFCVTAPPSPAGVVSLADRSYFIEAMRTGSFAVGDYSIGRFTQKRVQSFALPYLDRSGARGGVVSLSLNLDWLGTQFDGPQWNARQAFIIADRNGIILVRRPDEDGFVGKPVATDIWERAKQLPFPGNLDITSVADNQTRIAGMVPPAAGPGGLFIAVAVNRAFAFHDLEIAFQRGEAITAVAVLVSLLLAWLFARVFIRKPVALLIGVTRTWRGGDHRARGRIKGASEIRELGRAFDELADTVEEALHHKDMLLRELSHRVMNSLQTMAGLFSLQARQITDPDAKRQFSNAVARINSVALAYRRMQAQAGVELIDFAEFLRELCADLHRSLMNDASPCIVEADPVMLGTDQAMPLALVVNELVTNALKHGDSDVPVTIRLGRATIGCRLAVRNGGTLPLNYDPGKTTGFGMRMVTQVVAQLEGRLEASSMGGETEFAVSFVPKVPQPTILTVIPGSGNQTNPILMKDL